MKFSTKGLVIRQQNIGETDRLVWVLTESHGVIRAFVRRAQNIKSPKRASTGLLCYSKITVFEGKESYSIDEAEAVEQFIGLRSDIENLSLAQYFCELCLHLAPKESEAGEYLRLMLNSLYFLSTKKRPPLLVKTCFEMRLISLCGYMPDLVMCPVCGAYEKDEMVFSPENGKLLCASCADENRFFGVRLPLSAVTALRHTVYADFEKLFSFSLPDDQMALLTSASEKYLIYMTGREYPTLQFYKGLLNT